MAARTGCGRSDRLLRAFRSFNVFKHEDRYTERDIRIWESSRFGNLASEIVNVHLQCCIAARKFVDVFLGTFDALEHDLSESVLVICIQYYHRVNIPFKSC